MKVLIDTNVILDVLCDRRPFSADSAKIFKLCEIGRIKGYISALSVPNIIYIMRRELDEAGIKEIINRLSMIFKIADLKSDDLQKALELGFSDYEDALQSACAMRIGADYVVTRNTKDFASSAVPAVTPTELLDKVIQ